MNNTQKLFFLDTNSFYYFCDYLGSKKNVGNVKSNKSVDYSKLYNEFDKILKSDNNLICLSPCVILETLTHFKDKDIVDYLWSYVFDTCKKRGYRLGIQSYFPFFVANDSDGRPILEKIIHDGIKASNFCKIALESKIKSEAELVFDLSYYLFAVTLFMFFRMDVNKYNNILNTFGTLLIETFEKSIKNPSVSNIERKLKSFYKQNKEDKSVQSMINGLLESFAIKSLNILELSAVEKDSEAYNSFKMFLTSITGCSAKKIRRWYLDYARDMYVFNERGIKIKIFEEIIDTVKPAILGKTHNEGQFCYIKEQLSSFYNTGKLLTKNDSEDYWLMFLTSKGFVISFDDNIRKIIRIFNAENADYINNLSNKKI